MLKCCIVCAYTQILISNVDLFFFCIHAQKNPKLIVICIIPFRYVEVFYASLLLFCVQTDTPNLNRDVIFLRTCVEIPNSHIRQLKKGLPTLDYLRNHATLFRNICVRTQKYTHVSMNLLICANNPALEGQNYF